MVTVLVDQIYVCRSQWPFVLRRGSAVECMLGLRVRIAPEEGIFFSSVVCVVLSGTCLYCGLITRLEECYRVWCVQRVWTRGPIGVGYDPESGRSAEGKKKKIYIYIYINLITKMLNFMYTNSSEYTFVFNFILGGNYAHV